MVELLLLSSYDMDWSLLFCFVWINFVSIQAFSNNNEHMARLIKFLQRKDYQNPFNNEVIQSKIDNANDVNFNDPNIQRYAVVNMDIINGKTRPKPKKELTYHGNGKWGMPYRSAKRYRSPKSLRISNHESINEDPSTIDYANGINTHNPNIKRYGVVNMDIINVKTQPKPKKELTYHGNDKWGVALRNSNSYKSPKGFRISQYESSDEDRRLKSALRALVSYQEFENTVDDSIDEKKLNPGDTLLQLKDSDLASAGKFPVNEKSTLVYGNLANLGITYGKSNQRLEYSNFRKSNNGMDLLNTVIPKSNSGSKKWIVVEITPNSMRNPFLEMIRPMDQNEVENNANEIVDEYDIIGENTDYRRQKKTPITPYRKRDEYNNDWKSGNESESSSSSGSSSEDSKSSSETNPGNPFTLFKGNYRQNWMWNHAMDGDHMNINPYSPLFHDMGATGQDLYFNRKWWYFNQDDYKPMG